MSDATTHRARDHVRGRAGARPEAMADPAASTHPTAPPDVSRVDPVRARTVAVAVPAAPAVATRAVSVLAPPGRSVLAAAFLSGGSRTHARPDDRVVAGRPLLAVEAMKPGTVLPAPAHGAAVHMPVTPGSQVTPGLPPVVLAPRSAA